MPPEKITPEQIAEWERLAAPPLYGWVEQVLAKAVLTLIAERREFFRFVEQAAEDMARTRANLERSEVGVERMKALDRSAARLLAEMDQVDAKRREKGEQPPGA